MALNVKQIDDKSYWVYSNPQKPVKVKLRKQKDKFMCECRCFKFESIGGCEHVDAIHRQVSDKQFHFPKIKKLQVEEFIGGDVRQQILDLIKILSY